MVEELSVQLDGTGIHLIRAGAKERTYPWSGSHWALDLRDTRLPNPPIGPISGVAVRHAMGRPRVTEFSPEGARVDRTLLGLPEDARADPVLLTNSSAPGELSLHFGPLHIHSARVDDAQAREILRAAVERGFEVRRSTGFAVLPHGGSAWCLVTEITNLPGPGTPEVAR